MGTVIVTAASIAAMTASGVALSAIFKWLHEFELGKGGKSTSKRETMRGGFDHDRVDFGKGPKRGN